MNFKIARYSPRDVNGFQFLKDTHGILHNFYPSILSVNGLDFQTSEAVYQALKFRNIVLQQDLASLKSPYDAKRLAREHSKQIDYFPWANYSVKAMLVTLWVKVLQDNAFKKHLLAMDNRPIVEISSKDGFWGCCKGLDGSLSGYNVLGLLLTNLKLYIEDKSLTRPPVSIEQPFFNINGVPVDVYNC